MKPRSHHLETRLGLLYGVAAYVSWGLVPAYYKLVKTVPPIQVLAHRILWSVLLLIPILAWRRQWPEVRDALTRRRMLLTLAASTACVSVNWFTFIYAIANDRVLESSLGYYMNPLVVVALALAFFKERLRPWQVVSVLLAAAAVAILTVAGGRFPTISITLALSFALYGLIRKNAPVGAIPGLFVETLLLLPIALAFIAWEHATGRAAGAAYQPWWRVYPVLAISGVVTALPLIWFANAARRLRFTTMGLLQYLAPTGSFLLAVTFFGERITTPQAIAFPMIWVALVIYSTDAYRAYRATREPAPTS